MPAFSSQPAAFVQNVWRDRAARFFILTSMLLTLGLLVGVIILIPLRSQVSIGFDPGGFPLPAVAPEKLLLLPTLTAIIVAVSLSTGLFYYRNVDQRMAAYLILAGSGATPFLLLLSLIFIR